MIVVQPVLEMTPTKGFGLWPVAETDRVGFLPLNGELPPAEIGTALMRIAACNDVDPDDFGDLPPRPTGPIDGFLHGLLNFSAPYAAGGLRITDRSTGIVFSPGCCDGLEDWPDWRQLVDGSGMIGYGHDPQPSLAERLGDTVRLTVNTDLKDGPVIDVPVSELPRLLAGVERDLTGFLAAATGWIAEHLPDHSVSLTSALARVLALPAPDAPSVRMGTKRT